MSDADNSFEVERILKRKLADNGDFHYLLKWKGYPRERTWEPLVNMDGCGEMLDDFERKQAKRAINVRINERNIEYLIEQKDDIPPVVVPSVQAFEKWPQLIFEYLEERLFFVRSTTNSNQTTRTESSNVVGQPMNISYVSDVASKGLEYWCEWPLQQGKFVHSTECIEKWPCIVQTFLESKINEVNEEERSSIGKRMMTRRQRRLAAQFETVYGVRIDRKVDFDKVLILKQSRVINKRHTIGGDQIMPTPKSCFQRRKSLAPRRVTFNLPPTPTGPAQSAHAPCAQGSTASVSQPDPSTPALPIANVGTLPVANVATDSNRAASNSPTPPALSNSSARGAKASAPQPAPLPPLNALAVNIPSPAPSISIMVRKTYSPSFARQTPQSPGHTSKMMVQKPE